MIDIYHIWTSGSHARYKVCMRQDLRSVHLQFKLLVARKPRRSQGRHKQMYIIKIKNTTIVTWTNHHEMTLVVALCKNVDIFRCELEWQLFPNGDIQLIKIRRDQPGDFKQYLKKMASLKNVSLLCPKQVSTRK